MNDRVFHTLIGNRPFLNVLGNVIPVERIKSIETDNVPNGGCDNTVRITTVDGEEFYYAYDNADKVRAYLESRQFEV